MTDPVMSPLEAALWYLSLPVLYYVSYRFVLLNLKQYQKLNPPPTAAEPEVPPPAD